MIYSGICKINNGQKSFGSLKWGRDGLKVIFRAESFGLHEGIYRVYAYSSKFPEKKHLIGVLEPEGNIMALTKGFSDHELSINGFNLDEIDSAEAVLCTASGEMKEETIKLSWDLICINQIGLKDQVLLSSASARLVLAKKIDGRTFIAEPIKHREELMLAPAVSLAKLMEINGILHAVYEVENGFLKSAENINFLLG
ncbi:MAG: hypothetical protein N2Z65_04180 [Clostridiales bacterium]|nr:hypothetical protein [Clostridiales bacterium]